MPTHSYMVRGPSVRRGDEVHGPSARYVRAVIRRGPAPDDGPDITTPSVSRSSRSVASLAPVWGPLSTALHFASAQTGPWNARSVRTRGEQYHRLPLGAAVHCRRLNGAMPNDSMFLVLGLLQKLADCRPPIFLLSSRSHGWWCPATLAVGHQRKGRLGWITRSMGSWTSQMPFYLRGGGVS